MGDIRGEDEAEEEPVLKKVGEEPSRELYCELLASTRPHTGGGDGGCGGFDLREIKLSI